MEATDRKVSDRLAARLLREAVYVRAGRRDAFREAKRISLVDGIVASEELIQAGEGTEQDLPGRAGALEESADDTGAKGLPPGAPGRTRAPGG